MRDLPRLMGLVLALNVVRYVVGGPLEAVTVMGPMHAVMPRHPGVFDAEFTPLDFAVSLLYNYVLWFTATLVFHLLHPVLRGSLLVRSLKSYGLMALFFCALAAVYMNHFTAAVKPFYAWSMVDAVIVFTLVALANAALYPRFFPRTRAAPAAAA